MSVWWQSLSRRERVLLALLGVLLAAAAAWRAAVEPAVTRIQRLRRDLAAAEAALKEHRSAQAALDSYRARLAQLQQAAVAAAHQVPRDLEPAAVGVFLEQAARQAGARLVAIDLGPGPASGEAGNGETGNGEAGRGGRDRQQGAREDSRFRSWPVKIEVAGTYGQVLDFVRVLERWERLWRLERLELTPSSAGARNSPGASAPGEEGGTAFLRGPAPPAADAGPARAVLELVLFTDAEAPPLEERHLEELGVVPQETVEAAP